MKIPEAKKLPSGNWNVRLMVNGQRLSVTAATKRAAEQEAAAIKSGVKAAKQKSSLTVGESIDQYIESKNAVLSPSTIAGYQRIRNNAMQELMGVEVNAVTAQAVQRAVNRMAKEKSPKHTAF